MEALCLPASIPKHVCDLLAHQRVMHDQPSSTGRMCECGRVRGVQRCSTSYVRLPADYPKPLSSHRPQDLGILWNDTWVSVTSGSEDYSFKVCDGLPAALKVPATCHSGCAVFVKLPKWLAVYSQSLDLLWGFS